MQKAQPGSYVTVAYKGTLRDGSVFDEAGPDQALEFKIGEDGLIPGFEKAIVGMSIGETKTVEVQPTEGYGERQDNSIITISRDRLPEGMEAKIGARLPATNASGKPMEVVVTALTDTTVTLDRNHPLAGKELTFTITLMKVK